jgi:putative endonuclease
MLNRKQQYGQQSESVAAAALKRKGYKIIERNYRTRTGEIDIIAKDGDVIVFVEVKARQSTRYGNPKQAVTRLKQQKIAKAALTYLKATGQLDQRARFDVVAIQPAENGPAVEIVKNAFQLIGI